MRGTLAVLALITLTAAAGAAAQWSFAGGAATGTIRISGGSTLRSWSCDVTEFDASVHTMPAAGVEVSTLPSGRERASFDIPVRGIDCRNGTMNGHLREALRGEDHPVIGFELDGYRITSPNTLTGTGRLTIAGRTTPVTVDATYAADEGTLRVHGSKELVMTELGVRPPTLMLGTLKVHDRITIAFDLVIRQAAVTVAASSAAGVR